MQILRKYQLDIIFLFFALLALVWALFYGLKFLGADPHEYEWLMVGPLILFYLVWVWQIRKEISIQDRRTLTGKTLVYWIALGILLFASYSTPVPASDYWSVNAFFLVFTLLLADSYWDFKTLTINSLFKK